MPDEFAIILSFRAHISKTLFVTNQHKLIRTLWVYIPLKGDHVNLFTILTLDRSIITGARVKCAGAQSYFRLSSGDNNLDPGSPGLTTCVFWLHSREGHRDPGQYGIRC